MKNIKRLNIILHIVLILGIVWAGVYPLIMIFAYKTGKPSTLNQETIEFWTPLIFSKIAIYYIMLLLGLYGIFILRQALQDFYQRQLFNNVLSKAFKKIGYIIIIGTLIYIILDWFTDFIFSKTRTYGINAMYLIHAGTSLFFLTLSTMIDKAKGIQNENNLTI